MIGEAVRYSKKKKARPKYEVHELPIYFFDDLVHGDLTWIDFTLFFWSQAFD